MSWKLGTPSDDWESFAARKKSDSSLSASTGELEDDVRESSISAALAALPVAAGLTSPKMVAGGVAEATDLAARLADGESMTPSRSIDRGVVASRRCLRLRKGGRGWSDGGVADQGKGRTEAARDRVNKQDKEKGESVLDEGSDGRLSQRDCSGLFRFVIGEGEDRKGAERWSEYEVGLVGLEMEGCGRLLSR